MLKIPFEEGRGKQNFFPFHASDETASGLWHDVVLLSVTFHELPNIVTADVGVFNDQAHLAELVLEVIWHANIHFHTTKQMLISHLVQNSLGAHRFHLIQLSFYFGSDESLQFTIVFLHLSLFTLPHLYHVVSFTLDILGVGSCFFQQLTHGLLALFVKIFTTVERAVMPVPIAAMELIDGLCLCVEFVHRESAIADTLLGVVELMADVNSLLLRHPFQPFDRHLHRTF